MGKGPVNRPQFWGRFFCGTIFLKIDYVRFVVKWCPPKGLKTSYLVCQFIADSPFWSLNWKAVE